MEWHVIVREDRHDDVILNKVRNHGKFYLDLFNGTPWRIKDRGLLDDHIRKTEIGINQYDLLVLAMVVFSIDHMINRKYSDDNWQRNITIYLPVQQPDIWAKCEDVLNNLLNFLSGDKWSFRFRKSKKSIKYQNNIFSSEHICLLSGGADSLVGAIDLLEKGKNVEFVGHHGKGITLIKQKEISDTLKKNYTNQTNFNFFFVEAPKTNGMTVETTTRARSFLFIALAACKYHCNEKSVNLYIPENGLISLNVPLTHSRTGSLSTKTTHPYYLMMYQKLFDALGFDLKIISDYRFMTKGEMFKNCMNIELLDSLLEKTMSCSHPEQSRWTGKSPKLHCGRCLPCLIRKAAIKKAGFKDAKYATNVLSKAPDPSKKGGSDYRAIQMGVERFLLSTNKNDYFLVRNSGPLGDNEIEQFISVYQRGMNELSTLLFNRTRDTIL
ncbi:MAG: hypothetical protein JW866_09355 [Ignavibacteriales bacterium]|nr:hypothetical protein [Ignavibacteriales bacterium]